jgi:SRSO17 transposase
MAGRRRGGGGRYAGTAMERTPTPPLAPGVRDRLEDYARGFRPLFQRIDQSLHARDYLHGLLLDGARKSVEPMARRLGVDDQALQQFVNQSPWDEASVLRAYRRRMADAFAEPGGTIVIDDTSIPKSGHHSVGVASQWCGLRQKRTNCQVAVSVHYRTASADYPLAVRLYLPESWTHDPDRLTAVGVPEDEQDLRPKWRIALDLLDTVLAEDLPAGLIVADGAYGECGAFRQGLEDRGVPYIVGLMGTEKVTTAPPVWIRPRPGRAHPRAHLDPAGAPPVAVRDLAATVRAEAVTWTTVTGPRTGQFAVVRVWPVPGYINGVPLADLDQGRVGQACWLLVQWQSDGKVVLALSNLPAATPLAEAVAGWKGRWDVECGYRQLKQELGFDHFEGRSWRGFHHHAAMTFLAYGFLALERARPAEPPPEDPWGPPPESAAEPSEGEPALGEGRRVGAASAASDAPSRRSSTRPRPASSVPAAATPSASLNTT